MHDEGLDGAYMVLYGSKVVNQKPCALFDGSCFSEQTSDTLAHFVQRTKGNSAKTKDSYEMLVDYLTAGCQELRDLLPPEISITAFKRWSTHEMWEHLGFGTLAVFHLNPNCVILDGSKTRLSLSDQLPTTISLGHLVAAMRIQLMLSSIESSAARKTGKGEVLHEEAGAPAERSGKNKLLLTEIASTPDFLVDAVVSAQGRVAKRAAMDKDLYESEQSTKVTTKCTHSRKRQKVAPGKQLEKLEAALKAKAAKMGAAFKLEMKKVEAAMKLEKKKAEAALKLEMKAEAVKAEAALKLKKDEAANMKKLILHILQPGGQVEIARAKSETAELKAWRAFGETLSKQYPDGFNVD